MPERIRTADIIGRRLYDAGVRFAFGIPGGEVLTLIDGLEKREYVLFYQSMKTRLVLWLRAYIT